MSFIWGVNFSVVKGALADFSPLSFNAVRFGTASLILLSLLWLRERNLGIRKKDVGYFVMLGLIGNTAYQLFFINGIALTTATNSSLILATTPIFIVLFGAAPRLQGDRRTGLSEQLFALFIHTDHWFLRIVGASVDAQQLVHPIPIFAGDPADAPHQLAPGFAGICFNIWRTVSRLTLASPGRCRAAAVSRRTVQRLRPPGGVLQASATTSASWSV
jgi:hypothetical protein